MTKYKERQPLEINHILIPIDFSDGSRKAFYVAMQYAEKFGSKVHVLHVQEPITTFDDSARNIQQTLQEQEILERGVQRRVDELYDADQLHVQPDQVTAVVRSGNPYAEIVNYADAAHIDLIIMCTHGRTGLGRVIMGSTTQRVMRRSACPVLVIKPDEFEFHPA